MKVILEEQALIDIADAIRAINGSSEKYNPYNLAERISQLPLSGFTCSHDGNGNVVLTTGGANGISEA